MKENLLLAFASFPAPLAGGIRPEHAEICDLSLRRSRRPKEANATFRPILDGPTRSGFRIDVHEVFLLPGSTPHHGHRHQQEVLFLVSEGELQVNVAGKTARTRPGLGRVRRVR